MLQPPGGPAADLSRRTSSLSYRIYHRCRLLTSFPFFIRKGEARHFAAPQTVDKPIQSKSDLHGESARGDGNPLSRYNLCKNGNFFGSSHFCFSSCRHFVDSLRRGISPRLPVSNFDRTFLRRSFTAPRMPPRPYCRSSAAAAASRRPTGPSRSPDTPSRRACSRSADRALPVRRRRPRRRR